MIKPDLLTKPVAFGTVHTDHILECDFINNAWQDPKISEYHSLQLDPLNATLHYAINLFEGMKAFKTDDGKINLFRPDMNMKRMNISAKRVTLPVNNTIKTNI